MLDEKNCLWDQAVELIGDFHLLVGIQMAVGVHGCLHLFMAQAFRDQQWGESQLYEQ